MVPPNRWSPQTVTQKNSEATINTGLLKETKKIYRPSKVCTLIFGNSWGFSLLFFTFLFFSNQTKSFRDDFYSSFQLPSTTTCDTSTNRRCVASGCSCVYLPLRLPVSKQIILRNPKKTGQRLRSGGCRGEFGTINMPRIGGKKPTPQRAGLAR